MMDKINAYLLEGRMEEPWVNLANHKALAAWGRDEEITYNQINRQIEKAVFYRRTFDFLTDNRIHGDYYEFGCHRCRTFRMALTEARKHNLSKMQFWAFDSFEGLPEPTSDTSIEIWKRRMLTTTESDFISIVKNHGIYADNVKIVKGFYDESLSQELIKELSDSGRRAALINIDCDLYESAVPVFKFIDPLIQEGTVIYIDDLFTGYKGSPHRGVAKAFLEFQKISSWKFQRHLDVGWGGRAYIAYIDQQVTDGIL